MRKISICIVLFVLLVISIFTKVNAESKPHFYIDEAIKYENTETVSVQIMLENPKPEMATLSLRVGYDSSKLEYVNAKAGKDLNATMKVAEKVEDKDEIAIGALSLMGFSKSGTYYTVNFKVKETNVKEIPITLQVKEATDADGNDIQCEATDGAIKISKESSNNVEQTTNIEKIPIFETNEIQDFQTLEEIIMENADIEFSNVDVLEYESLDNNVVEVSNDGTLLPKDDGTTKVKVKLNDNQIAEMEVAVENGKVINIKSLEDFSDNQDLSEKSIENRKFETYGENKTGTLSVETNNSPTYVIIAIVLVVIVVIIISFIIKKKRGGNK